MRSTEEVEKSISTVKEEIKKIKRTYGKNSYEYVDAIDELDMLYDELEFSELYM